MPGPHDYTVKPEAVLKKAPRVTLAPRPRTPSKHPHPGPAAYHISYDTKPTAPAFSFGNKVEEVAEELPGPQYNLQHVWGKAGFTIGQRQFDHTELDQPGKFVGLNSLLQLSSRSAAAPEVFYLLYTQRLSFYFPRLPPPQ